MKRRIIIGLAWVWVAVSVGAISTEHGQESVVAETERRTWLAEAADHLRGFSLDDREGVPDVEFYQTNRMEEIVWACRVYGVGLIRLSPEDWVYVVMHSVHKDPAIGDIILAIDQTGVIRENRGHVCGGASFMSFDLRRPATSEEFFAWFVGDNRDSTWQVAEIEGAGVTPETP